MTQGTDEMFCDPQERAHAGRSPRAASEVGRRFAALIEERSDLVERLGEIDSTLLELEDEIAEPFHPE